jgi:hypothetical protein
LYFTFTYMGDRFMYNRPTILNCSPHKVKCASNLSHAQIHITHPHPLSPHPFSQLTHTHSFVRCFKQFGR